MKRKKLFRSVTALLAALVLMGGFSVTAFAGGGDVSDEPPSFVCWNGTFCSQRS